MKTPSNLIALAASIVLANLSGFGLAQEEFLPPLPSLQIDRPVPSPKLDSRSQNPLRSQDNPPVAEPIQRLPAPKRFDPPIAEVPAKIAPEEEDPLPPLEEELWNHGGSYLYAPEGDRLGWPGPHEESHFELLRLPEDHVDPEPITLFADFLGEDPVQQRRLKYFGPFGYHWDPQFVLYGGYEMSAITYKEDQQRRDGLGHQLIVDMDFRWTGTERIHLQFRPLGEGNSGGSFYQFSDPAGYIDNSTAIPQNYWFEGELSSMLSNHFGPFAVRDINLTAGKFPYAIHNQLLMNDEILGVIVSKNTLFLANLSNVNLQLVLAPSDVENVADDNCRLYGLHATADRKRDFYELSYFFLKTPDAPGRNQHFLAFSQTQFRGRWNTAGRALFKFGDQAGAGDGQLLVLESNFTTIHSHQPLGIEYSVAYCNLFGATQGWNSLAQGGFNRLRSAFDVDPLVAISTGTNSEENFGASLGVQLFRHHEGESFAPEIAFQAPGGDPVYGVGFRYQRKTGKRSFFEVLGIANISDTPSQRRKGVFVSQNILF